MIWSASRFLPFFAVLVAGLGCSGGQGECHPTFQYFISIDVSTAPRAPCQVDFRAGTVTASYTFDTLPDPYVDACSEQHAQPPCTPLDGSPQPTFCEASPCWLTITFYPGVARDLSAFMGADSFTAETSCGGQVSPTISVRPITQACGA